MGIGPTNARAEAGLPLNTRQPEAEPEYGGLLGPLMEKRDNFQSGVRDKLGINEETADALGAGLQGLSQYLMRGGF